MSQSRSFSKYNTTFSFKNHMKRFMFGFCPRVLWFWCRESVFKIQPTNNALLITTYRIKPSKKFHLTFSKRVVLFESLLTRILETLFFVNSFVIELWVGNHCFLRLYFDF